MNSIELCLKNNIPKAGKLKPIVWAAILNLYQRGLHQFTAEIVKNECDVLDNTVQWNARIPAICNSMRNATKCGGGVVGEDRSNNGFTIAFTDEDEGIEEENIISKPSKVDSTTKGSNLSIFSVEENVKLTADKKIKRLVESFVWDKIQDKKNKKLLIIGCSDTKVPGGNQELLNDYFNEENYDDFIPHRLERFSQYSELLLNPDLQLYFNKVREGIPVDLNYFNNQTVTRLYLPAVKRYFGGKFYSQDLINLYYEKNQESNLHILIVSGLYGIIEFRDSIIDYHLEINKLPFWTQLNNTSIRDAVINYIKENDIGNEMVFYSLSPSKYLEALKPIQPWTNIWIAHDRGDTSARFLSQEFLPRLS